MARETFFPGYCFFWLSCGEDWGSSGRRARAEHESAQSDCVRRVWVSLMTTCGNLEVERDSGSCPGANSKPFLEPNRGVRREFQESEWSSKLKRGFDPVYQFVNQVKGYAV